MDFCNDGSIGCRKEAEVAYGANNNQVPYFKCSVYELVMIIFSNIHFLPVFPPPFWRTDTHILSLPLCCPHPSKSNVLLMKYNREEEKMCEAEAISLWSTQPSII